MDFDRAVELHRAGNATLSESVGARLWPPTLLRASGDILRLILAEEGRPVFDMVETLLHERMATDLEEIVIGWHHRIAEESINKPLEDPN